MLEESVEEAFLHVFCLFVHSDDTVEQGRAGWALPSGTGPLNHQVLGLLGSPPLVGGSEPYLADVDGITCVFCFPFSTNDAPVFSYRKMLLFSVLFCKMGKVEILPSQGGREEE